MVEFVVAIDEARVRFTDDAHLFFLILQGHNQLVEAEVVVDYHFNESIRLLADLISFFIYLHL